MLHELKKPGIVPETPVSSPTYDASCRRCFRLATYLDEMRETHPGYRCLPVPPFGDGDARLVVVGLAPGLHGANATGRPFTGDFAGILLYETLHRYGFANQPHGTAPDDGLRLIGCRITNAVKCWPPQNKPLPEEIRGCNGYLRAELRALPARAAVLALGAIAHRAVLGAEGLTAARYRFRHGARHDLPSGRVLFDSYHCSRYNTQTGRLTAGMFRNVFAAISSELNPG